MKIISWNVNGIRSVCRKGFLGWLAKESPDILCLQEMKAQEGTIPAELPNLSAYTFCANFAEKRGYSGVSVFSKSKPKIVRNKLGIDRFDSEGRYLELDFGKFILINIYLPHGGRAKENLEYKLEAYNKLISRLSAIKKKVILAGDFNVAHTELDLARPKSNQNNIMFTPKERSQFDAIEKLGFVDSFRQFHQGSGHYTWWPWLANCRDRNLGWRIDYVFVSRSCLPGLKDGFILNAVTGSDHCPVGIALC